MAMWSFLTRRTAAIRPLPHAFKSSWRALTTVSHYPASEEAARVVPTPLILLSASGWSKEPAAQVSLAPFIERLSSNGWSVTGIDLDPEGELSIEGINDSEKILTNLVAELKQTLHNSGSPFPPLMVTQGLSSLIAETYVSSNSLSGLVLLNPPLSAEHACKQHPRSMPTPHPAFTYEPRFPCLVAWTPNAAKELAFWDVHRIEDAREQEAGEAVDRYIWDLDCTEDREKAGAYELQRWAEEQGICEVDCEAEMGDDVDDVLQALPNEELQTEKLPRWYIDGAYKRNPSGSKKEPLLMDERDLEESFIRGSGPGGQAINKLATCVQLKHLPTGRVIQCQQTRSRQDNRMYARRRMSLELEKIVFGTNSTLGKAAMLERRKKKAKDRKRKRKEKGSVARKGEGEGEE